MKKKNVVPLITLAVTKGARKPVQE